MSKDSKDFIKAKNYCLRLLRYRPRSTGEIKERLERKSFENNIIDKLIAYFEELGYLDDNEFARFWVKARINAKPMGVSLIGYELKQKKVSEDIIDRVLSELTKDYDEFKTALNLALKIKKRAKPQDGLKLKRRLYSHLKRRGFSDSVIYEVLEEAIKNK